MNPWITILTVIAAWAAVAVFAIWWYLRREDRNRVLARLAAPADEAEAKRLADRARLDQEPDDEDLLGSDPVTRWLALSGFRAPGAAWIFLLLTFSLFVLGLLLAGAVEQSGLFASAREQTVTLPGGVGRIITPVLVAGPYLLLVFVAAIPTLLVRRARQAIVREVETDLPIVLDLFATLAEAGLGFDSSLERVVRSMSADRILAQELRTFQAEVLSGRPRINCFRRLAYRVDVGALNMFVSAVIQAEQSGSAIAGVLRRQATDLAQRRRERALEFAMTLPVRRLFPLVIGFLPGIFIAALGPAFMQLISQLDLFILGTGR